MVYGVTSDEICDGVRAAQKSFVKVLVRWATGKTVAYPNQALEHCTVPINQCVTRADGYVMA